MPTYVQNILPMCQGIAKCATEQGEAFKTYFLKPGQVVYDRKPGEQRLDDLYGALTSFCHPLSPSMSDKEKKVLIKHALDAYESKKKNARTCLELGMKRSGHPGTPKTAITWFDETQKILNDKVDKLRKALDGWST